MLIKNNKRKFQTGILLSGLSLFICFTQNIQTVEAQPSYLEELSYQKSFDINFQDLQAKSKVGDLVVLQQKPVGNIDYTFYYDIPFSYKEQEEIAQTCKEYNLEYELILAIIQTESTYNATKIGDSGQSYGLMQIQPRWWQNLMDTLNITDLLDPLQNVKCGCAILQVLMNSYHCSTVDALTYYNAGKICPAGEDYTERVLENYEKIRSQKK